MVFRLTGDKQVALGGVLQQSQYGLSSGSSTVLEARSTVFLCVGDGVPLAGLEIALPILSVVSESLSGVEKNFLVLK